MSLSPFDPGSPFPTLLPFHAGPAALDRITVCTRPFRAAGPRIEAERVGNKLVIHNYGHGGAGWSLSWGSAGRVLPLAIAGNPGQPFAGQPEIGVIGCGALGLTAASLLQQNGARVTIYAREAPQHSRSARATGSWTPDSRVAIASGMGPHFAAEWESMARFSYRRFESMLDLPRQPVRYTERFFLSETPWPMVEQRHRDEDPIGFVWLADRLADITPAFRDFDAHAGQAHPFPTRFCRRTSALRFDIAPYADHLFSEFQANGGRFVTREFHTPADLENVPEPVLVHCTGYGAHMLFGDSSLTPVRGQIAWLAPQPEAPYGLVFDTLNILSRAEGVVVQANELGERTGWNDASEAPDEQAARAAIQQLAAFQNRITLATQAGQPSLCGRT